MLSVALRTLHTRCATFVGAFVALSLGVALLTVMGLALDSSSDAPGRKPERFAAAPVVVKGTDTLRCPPRSASVPRGSRTRERCPSKPC